MEGGVTEPESLLLQANGWMPNNPVLPVLIYRGVVEAGDPSSVEARLRRNGWRPDWRDGVYPFHHYHSTAHEALACTTGAATLMLGGEGGRQAAIAPGDVLVLPSGTGHCRVAASADFLLVGAYPDGQRWDVCRAAADVPTLRRIAQVPLPSADPVDGADGALSRLWRGEGSAT